jgi:hypothetical protein
MKISNKMMKIILFGVMYLFIGLLVTFIVIAMLKPVETVDYDRDSGVVVEHNHEKKK